MREKVNIYKGKKTLVAMKHKTHYHSHMRNDQVSIHDQWKELMLSKIIVYGSTWNFNKKQ
jgi:hypothetical protein